MPVSAKLLDSAKMIESTAVSNERGPKGRSLGACAYKIPQNIAGILRSLGVFFNTGTRSSCEKLCFRRDEARDPRAGTHHAVAAGLA